MSKKLTKTVVDATKCDPARDVWLWDLELPGFGVRIQPSDRRTYVIRYRNADGAQRKMTLARVADMPPDRARDLARKRFAEVAEGADPAAERQAARVPTPASTKTVGRLFEAYVANMKAKKAESAAEVERVLLKAKTNAADALGRHLPAADVTPADVVRFVGGFFKAGHRGAADKARSYISSAFNWAMKAANDYTVENPQDWGITTNPVAAVARDQEASREIDRNLAIEELREVWLAAVSPEESGFSLETAVCIQTLIGTGQRVQETLRLDGAELDLEGALWHMPTEKTKTKRRPHTVPLPRQVIPGLMALKAKHGDGPLFPGRQGEARIGHRSINQAIGRWLEGDGVTVAHFTTRDIRRTWKSRAHDAGISRELRDLIQQHAKNDTGSKHYDRAEYLPQMRQAMAMWSDWLEGALHPDKPKLARVV